MLKTMAPRGVDRVHVASPSAALSKRQATLQILVRADGKQHRLAIIFRGEGNISDAERRMLEALDIDVLRTPLNALFTADNVLD